MQPSLNEIQKPIEGELKAFERHFRQSLSTKVMLLDKIMDYIVSRKGKQVRPILVFLCARLFGEPNDKTYRGASLIELLHTATLVHDDVVDDSNYRRGFFSVNALWKNKIAVLVGDFLLSRGLLLSIEHGDFDLLKTVTQAVREMSEGELLQMEKSRLLDISESVYFDIIRQKTASLISSCCVVGGYSTGANADQLELLEQFGTKLGIAFQIKDDLFDYGQEGLGKPVGIDIKEKKMTLPLIYALQHAERSERRHIVNLVKNESDKGNKVKEVIEFVRKRGGIEYTLDVLDDYKKQALRLLNMLPEGEASLALGQLVEYTVSRQL